MNDIAAFEGCDTLLVVVAHADDLETMCGGTLVQLLARGKTVDLLIATAGDRGAEAGTMDRLTLAALRRAEATRAGRLLGLRHIRFLSHPDGELVNDLALRRQVAYLYRTLQPDTVLTFDPLAAYRANLHPDHLAIAQAAIDAFMPAKMPLYHPEQLAGGVSLSRVQRLFCFATPEPDVVVPVDDVYPQKLAASQLHQSQFPKGEESLEWMKERDRETARRYAAPDVQFAEAFRTIATY